MFSRVNAFPKKLLHRSYVRRVIIVYAALLLGGLLYPFTFRFPVHTETNNVQWLSQSCGVMFSHSGIIRSVSPVYELHNALVSGNGLTVEVWLATKSLHQEGPARIISYSSDRYSRNFTLGQQGQSLVMRLRTTETDLNGTKPEFTVENVFQSDAPAHIAMTYDFQHEIVYINGQQRLQSSLLGGTFANWDPSYNLALGNELTGNRPWRGQLFLVALYKRALSAQEIVQNYQAGNFFASGKSVYTRRVTDELAALYTFDEKGGNIVKDRNRAKVTFDLFVPQELEITQKIFPTDYLRTHTKSVRDIVLNVVAFIPFGCCLHIKIRKLFSHGCAVHLVTIGLGILFTFSIESVQFFLETRDSSMIDVLSNTIGIASGAIVYSRYSGAHGVKNR